MRPANDNAPAVRTLFYGLNALCVGTVISWLAASQIAGLVAFSVALMALAQLGERR